MTLRQALVSQERDCMRKERKKEYRQKKGAAIIEKDCMRKERKKEYRQKKQGQNKEGQEATQMERKLT